MRMYTVGSTKELQLRDDPDESVGRTDEQAPIPCKETRSRSFVDDLDRSGDDGPKHQYTRLQSRQAWDETTGS